MTPRNPFLLILLATSFPAFAEFSSCNLGNPTSRAPGIPRGGALATITCSGIRGGPGLVRAPSSSPLPFVLAGTRVLVNGALAPILSVYLPADESTPAQIVFQVPLERNSTIPSDGILDIPRLDIRLPTSNDVGIWFDPNPYAAVGPGAFFSDPDGYVLAEHASDHSPVTLNNPARPGETITAYANDLFPVWPPPPIGIPVPQQPRFQYAPELAASRAGADSGYLFLQDYPPYDQSAPTYTNTPALKILFQGLAPGKIGIEQIDFVVPQNQPPGDWALFFNRGSCPDGSGTACSTAPAGSSPPVLLPVR